MTDLLHRNGEFVTVHNHFFLMFQQDGTFCRVFYSLQTALHVSGETFTHRQELE
jgi:hypothetical protein